MVPPTSPRIPRVRGYSGSEPSASRFAYKTFTSFGRASHPVQLYYEVFISVRTPAVLLLPVWPLPISLATTLGISFDFSSYGYLDVSVPHVPLLNLLIQLRIPDSSSGWFPNSDICGSRYICYSPQLFAACHVLRRLPMPRHPPYALLRLNSLQTSSACSRSLELLELAFRKLFLL